ncbi:GNAT family N-acetyltransferase [Sphingopyxis sp.]|uniref:GNAT family N-acetyltransferase n=1 Tax=Sphingopyxis sp. TaxID=1908224 RepID=UPI002FC9EB19
MSDDLIIRAPVAADFDRWLPLWDGYNAFYGRSGDTALPADITAETWARFLDPRQPVHALVAETGGELVGLAHFLYHRSTTAIADSCYLQDLFTSQAARGRGVAGALLGRVGAAARAAGASRVYWLTHEGNGVARRLYDRLAEHAGFIVYRMAI